MVWAGCVSLYKTALGIAAALLFVTCFALLLACVAVVDLVEALLEQWVGVLVVLGAIALFAGCAAPAAPVRDARDPEIWRPTAPAVYPLPR